MAEPICRIAEPHVAVCVDKSRSYGRGVLQGVADFLEKIGPWSMFVDHYAVSQLSAGWNRRWPGDGILAYISDEATARRLLRSRIPVVDVAGTLRMEGLPRVVADDEAIGRLAAEHFLDRHFRRFAYVGPGDVLTDELRFMGFCRRVSGGDCVRYVHPRRARGLSEWERKQEKLAEWISRLATPVGIMAYSDVQAREVLDACARVGVSVPLEVAVVGVDNDEELCRLARVPLSSVAGNPRRIGFEAARMITALMNGECVQQEIIVSPLYVVPRKSSDVAAVDDLYVARALSFIQRNATQRIGIGDVARAVGLPRRSLYRRFADALDRTPHDELQRVRFERVRQLLTETDLPIADIARLCGFNAAYMATCFKRVHGLAPGEYRAMHRARS